MGFLWGIVACALVGAMVWWYGQYKAKLYIENQAVSLLYKISEVIKEKDPAKAQEIIKKYTSGEKKIRDILIFKNLEKD